MASHWCLPVIRKSVALSWSLLLASGLETQTDSKSSKQTMGKKCVSIKCRTRECVLRRIVKTELRSHFWMTCTGFKWLSLSCYAAPNGPAHSISLPFYQMRQYYQVWKWLTLQWLLVLYSIEYISVYVVMQLERSSLLLRFPYIAAFQGCKERTFRHQ